MCTECGCGEYSQNEIKIFRPGAETSTETLSSPVPSGLSSHGHEHHERAHSHPGLHWHDHPHSHIHSHSHAHDHRGDKESGTRIVQLERSLLEQNDRLAERNRGFFLAQKLFVVNMISAPGSGKTTLLAKTAEALKGKLRIGVIVGDLATGNDATRLQQAGIEAVQVTTGNVCHLDAQMVHRALRQLPLDSIDVLFIENVGNLVCPGDFDLGEAMRVVLFSVTEGEDKPLKYPPVFHSAQAVVITKKDLAEACGFDREQALEAVHRIAHHAELFELSARSGEGMDGWLAWLQHQRERYLQEAMG